MKAKKLFFFLLLLMYSGNVFPEIIETVNIDELYYSLNTEDETAVVVYDNSYGEISEILIPANVMYENTTYSVHSIGDRAFNNCWSLISVTISSGIISIDDFAFYACYNLQSIIIPNTTTSIGSQAFGSCKKLTNIDIPNSVTSIGSWVFADCSSLTSLSIPSSVTNVGEGAFQGCSSLTSFTIPIGVNDIGSLFYGCSGITNFYTETGHPYFNAVDGVVFSKNLKTIVQYPAGRADNNYVIPDNVENISGFAFVQCNNLVNVTFHNNVTYIGQSAFYECLGLTVINIPNSVTGISNAAFQDCSNLNAIYVDEENTYYSDIDGVLFNNNKTTLVMFPEGKDITDYSIPDGVEIIYQQAFRSCNQLNSITIPSSVESIDRFAFSGCWGLTTITCKATTPPTLGNNVFNNVDKSIPLYVPAESVEAYRAAEGWNDFTNTLPIPVASVAITANEDPQLAGTYYSTFYYSSGNYELPATGVEAFVATVSGSDMNLTRIAGGAGVIPQGTAVILRSTIQNYTLTLSDGATVFDGDNVLQGVDAATTTPANCYVLSAVDGVVGFYQYTGVQVGAHKAYLVYNGAGAPRRMRFIFDEENAATGVEEAESETANAVRSEKCIENGQLIIEANGVRYNAQGQKVK